MTDPRLLSVTQVCVGTGLGRTKVYDEMRSGRLRSVKVGRRRLVPAVALDEWVEGLVADVC